MLHAEYRLGRERLVNFVKVNVGQREGGEGEDARDGVGGPDTHNAWGDADGGCGDEFADDW